MSEEPRLRGTLYGSWKAKQEDSRDLPHVTFDKPQDFSGTFTIRFKDPNDGLLAGHVEIEVADDHVVILGFGRDPRRQKGGYGSACFKAALDYIEQNAPGKQIRLFVSEDNVRAIKLYKVYGFHFVDTKAETIKEAGSRTMVRN